MLRLLSIIVLTLILGLDSGHYSKTFDLKVKVMGHKSWEGMLRGCVTNDARRFLNDPQWCVYAEIGGEEDSWLIFGDLIPGRYAVSVYHDENNNQKIDRGWLGIPVEDYGFSNNPSTLFGPPSFARASFELHYDLEITIKL